MESICRLQENCSVVLYVDEAETAFISTYLPKMEGGNPNIY